MEEINLSETMGALLRRRGWRMAIAESATGGLLGYWITQTPGCSDYFSGGVITYDNSLKERFLGVSKESMIRWGAVSAQAALDMAAGVQRAAGVEVGVGITGIAGPGGGTLAKPVGLYFIGVAFPGERWIWRHLFTGDRDANNQEAARVTLHHLVDYLRAQ